MVGFHGPSHMLPAGNRAGNVPAQERFGNPHG
jgi:hypothetical protein